MVLFVLLALGDVSANDLIFPRINLSTDGFVGAAFSNTGQQAATLNLTLLDSSGKIVGTQAVTIATGQQLAFLVSDLFSPPAGNYWLRAQSDQDSVTGVVLFGDSSILDGFGAPDAATEQVLPLVQQDSAFSTQFWIVNPSGTTLPGIAIQAVSAGGGVLQTQKVSLAAGQQLSLDAGSLDNAAAVSYLRIISDLPVVAVETVLNKQDKNLVAITGRSVDTRLATSYVPQFVSGAGSTSELGLVNQTDQTVVATITAFAADGSLFFVPQVTANPVTRAIPARGSLRETIQSLFGFSAAETKQGWLRIETNIPALSSFVTFGTAGTRAAAVSQLAPLTNAVFSHQANGSGFSTTLSLLNQAALTANVTIASVRKDGSLAQAIQKTLTPGQRLSDSVAKLLPAAADVIGGLIWIRSDVPMFMAETFGTTQEIASVPADLAADSFRPDSNRPDVSLKPALIPVELGSSAQFSAKVANAAQAVSWSVNGIPGGNAQLGTISSTGVYRAPSQLPSPQVITVEARSQADPDRSAGSTVELLKRQSLGGVYTLPRAVAYIDSLKKLYVAELALLSVKQAGAAGSNAVISEVRNANGDRTPLLSLPNELIEKMLPFNDKGGNSYLLMAGHETGQIYRLRVDNRSLVVVAGGFNKPSSMALDPISGDLLIAQEGGGDIRVLSHSSFDPSPAGKRSLTDDWPALRAAAGGLFQVNQPAGVIIDQCSGLIYATDKAGGRLLEYNRITGVVRDVLAGVPLVNPNEMLGLYRNGLYCNHSFTILLGEEGNADNPARILQIDPHQGILNTWLVTGNGVADLLFLPRGNPYIAGGSPAVLGGENLPNQAKLIYLLLLEVYKDSIVVEKKDQPPLGFSASGQIIFHTFGTPIPGVLLELSSGQTTTSDISGLYQFTGLKPGSYKITPKSSQFAFDPASLDFTITGFNLSALDFRADVKTFSISGQVLDKDGKPIPGVTVTAGSYFAVTDANGNYTISGLLPGTYQVKAAKSGFAFAPLTQSVTVTDANVSGINFLGQIANFVVSGFINDASGNPVPNVTVDLCPGTLPCSMPLFTGKTDAMGVYRITGVPNGTYNVRPHIP
jgi:protocatechuate 3,4-dioxygenase beta subunit